MVEFAILISGAMLFVAYSNGANDNFKGVATLFGSGIADYRKALWWATATTFAGSVAVMVLTTRLISVFQGKGLVPDALVQSPVFLASVIFGAAVTVIAATVIGMPISTTHSLTDALLGSGFVAVGFNLHAVTLWQNFFLPLLASPLIAVLLSVVVYPLLNGALRLASINKETCLCVGSEVVPVMATAEGFDFSNASSSLRVIVGRENQCLQRLTGTLWGVNVNRLTNWGHYLSAGAVSFARGLNDTPKIVALLLLWKWLEIRWGFAAVALTMAIGGLLNARKVADTVSKKITTMNHGQGFTANLTTAILVVLASLFGLPVSTTHVSVGSLFGIGLTTGKANIPMMSAIVLSWVVTLPCATIAAGATYWILKSLIS